MSKHFHLKTKTGNSCFISSHLQSLQFLELSRAVEPGTQKEIPGIRYAVDEAEAERCPQEESLKVVLRSLGIQEAKLQGDLHDFPGVSWGSLWQCNKNQPKKKSKTFWGKKSVTKSPWASQNATKQSCYEKLFFLG